MNKPDFGNGELEFSRWETPFENESLTVQEVSYRGCTLSVRVVVDCADGVSQAPNPIYLLEFEEVAAFRVLDEGGLLDMWVSRSSPSQSADSTFRVRNHPWTEESFSSFVSGTDDGWSFVIATHDDCVEILARNPPKITLEGER